MLASFMGESKNEALRGLLGKTLGFPGKIPGKYFQGKDRGYP